MCAVTTSKIARHCAQPGLFLKRREVATDQFVTEGGRLTKTDCWGLREGFSELAVACEYTPVFLNYMFYLISLRTVLSYKVYLISHFVILLFWD